MQTVVWTAPIHKVEKGYAMTVCRLPIEKVTNTRGPVTCPYCLKMLAKRAA